MSKKTGNKPKHGGVRPNSGRKSIDPSMKRVAAIVYVQARLKDKFLEKGNLLRDELEKSN